jgi:hypothetical protein
MNKFLFIIIPALLIALLVYLFILHLQNLSSQKGALQVTSMPVSKVYLNDKYIGRTPISKTDATDMIQADNYTIRLVPVDTSFSEYQEKITISTGILTVVDRKFNKESLSEGYVISLIPLIDKNQTELEVISFPAGSKIDLDANSIGKTPLLYKKPTESDHILNIYKEGYNEKAIRIRTPKGYRLTVIAYLSIGPADAKPVQPATTISPSPSSTISPSPSEESTATKVLILDTPTGFLRVRESNNLNSAQITTVAPGETYAIINEETGWFEIKLTDGKTGWISSQYAKKQ